MFTFFNKYITGLSYNRIFIVEWTVSFIYGMHVRKYMYVCMYVWWKWNVLSNRGKQLYWYGHLPFIEFTNLHTCNVVHVQVHVYFIVQFYMLHKIVSHFLYHQRSRISLLLYLIAQNFGSWKQWRLAPNLPKFYPPKFCLTLILCTNIIAQEVSEH